MSCKDFLLALFMVVNFLVIGQENLRSAEPIRLPLPGEEAALIAIDDPHLFALKNLGPISCSSSNCHGSNQEGTARYRRAYTTWSQKDPHARAFETLSNDLSIEIGKRLGLPRLPIQSQVCLSCHASPVGHQKEQSEETIPANLEFASNGVSCEACHGAAEKWLEPHRSYDWKSALWSQERKASLGFKETKDIAIRVKQCAQCHIGGTGKDVNHQLIAAGHPRLFFEYTAYMDMYSQMAAHWDVANDARRFGVSHPNSPQHHALNSWMIGKLVSAQQSFELLSQRASSTKSDWPELTEYSCYACHHNLSRPSSKTSNWRQSAQQPSKQQQIPWNQWNLMFVSEVLEAADLDKTNAAQSLLSDLSRKMNRVDNISREQIAGMSQLSAEQFEGCLKKYQTQSLSFQKVSERLIQKISDSKTNRGINNWDMAAQYYLTLVPLSGSHLQTANSNSESRFEQIKNRLQFPTQVEHGESQAGLSRYNSPHWNDDKKLIQIRLEFDQILSELLHSAHR